MEFRPCIDIHNGKVKQIVGSSLRDIGDMATENFVAEQDADYYATLYRSYNLTGGHVIILNGRDSGYYEQSRKQALNALAAYPGGLMIGGGVNADNAKDYIDAGASHVLVTSYVFSDGRINMDNLKRLDDAVGASRVVLDLSCKFVGGTYYVVTDRWQNLTDEAVDEKLFDMLSPYTDEFLVHAVDSEGLAAGMDERIIGLLSQVNKSVCYAGGISSIDDILRLKTLGNGRVNFTVGSRLDIFGGDMKIEEIIECIR